MAVLIDTTKCIGCRSCQVSCKQSHGLPAERTEIEGRTTGYQNPPALSSKTLTLVTYNEIDDPAAPGGLRWVFAKQQCMQCDEPACVSACPVTALEKHESGHVTYDADKCMGCRYCVWACPFGIPTAEWDSLAPRIRKCDQCYDRAEDTVAATELNGAELPAATQAIMVASQSKPACAKACPTGALVHGSREELLTEARRRLAAEPARYVPHIYGEKEVGGTNTLYLSSVPFEKLGFRTNLGERSYPSHSKKAMAAVPPAIMLVGGVLAGSYMLAQRRAAVAAKNDDQET
jgi:formate dehydrogenase iron-sulfur subunit